MSVSPEIKGWCPGALRPMLSGDGFVVRVRPRAGRLTQDQAKGIAQAAQEFGNGLLDVSSRANVQIRGVAEGAHGALIDQLRLLGLIDGSAAAESQRNVMVTPFATDEDRALAVALESALTRCKEPLLPGKFGFAIDTGGVPILQSASADIRLEKDRDGGLLICADGAMMAKSVPPQTVVAEALALAEFFVANGGIKDGRGRMKALVRDYKLLPQGFAVPRQQGKDAALPGLYSEGALIGLAFGQIEAAVFAELAALGPLRLTPWRMILVEGVSEMPQHPGLICTPDDPLLRVVACTGAPRCTQALGETRKLARGLADLTPPGEMLHVSGCTKGCAHLGKAATTIVATQGGYDLIRNGRAAEGATMTNLTLNDLKKAI